MEETPVILMGDLAVANSPHPLRPSEIQRSEGYFDPEMPE